MICEPNFYLPQLIDLDTIQKSNVNKSDIDGNLISSSDINVSYEQQEYKILPLLKNQFDHLSSTLSLRSNKYLKCRWNSFLDHVTENFIYIRSYNEIKKPEAVTVRRKLLNGKLYDMNNKIAPIPQCRDS